MWGFEDIVEFQLQIGVHAANGRSWTRFYYFDLKLLRIVGKRDDQPRGQRSECAESMLKTKGREIAVKGKKEKKGCSANTALGFEMFQKSEVSGLNLTNVPEGRLHPLIWTQSPS
jgi:hypothetical protein